MMTTHPSRELLRTAEKKQLDIVSKSACLGKMVLRPFLLYLWEYCAWYYKRTFKDGKSEAKTIDRKSAEKYGIKKVEVVC